MMTRIEWIFSDEDHSLHQKYPSEDSISNPSDNTNPVELIIDFPVSFNVTQGHTGDEGFSQLSVDIPANIMDRMAIAWCEKRRLNGALNRSVGREFNSVDCDYDEQAFDGLEENTEIQANLEFDNIFEVIANTKEESDKLIQNRNINESGKKRSVLPTRYKRAALSILDRIRANQNVNDESSLLSVIEEGLLADHIMSSDDHLLNSTWQFEDKLATGAYAPGLDVNGRWLLVGTDRGNEKLVIALPPLSVKIVERLIQQRKLIAEKSTRWATSKQRLTMYRWKD